jgi:hypothetical protein
MALPTAKMFLRAAFIPDVMLLLYQADKCSRHARLEDIPIDERERYRQLAESAVMMACDPALRDVAEYFAAHQVATSRAIDFCRLPLVERWRILQDAQLTIRKFLAFVRGEWPQGIELYQRRLEADRQGVKDANTKRAADVRRDFPVIEGGKADV